MATPAVNEIESQFAHLPQEQQLALLERLVHQIRSGVERPARPAPPTPAAQAMGPENRRDPDRARVDFRAAATDLLGET